MPSHEVCLLMTYNEVIFLNLNQMEVMRRLTMVITVEKFVMGFVCTDLDDRDNIHFR